VQSNIDATTARLESLADRVELAALHVTVQQERILGPVGYVVHGAWRVVRKLFIIRD